MIPSWSMCSNSCLAARRWSGARRLGRAETGGPVVLMWWVTSCLIGVSGEQTCVRAGNSDSRVRQGLLVSLWKMDGLGEGSVERMP